MICALIFLDAILSKVISALDKAVKREESLINLKTLDYCFVRELVICPRCRTSFRIETYDQQFTTEWQCSCCGCTFEETSTHTINHGGNL